ncbi:MAG: amidohydrolase family protein [Verrucomicrobia bacterium]|nr:amidohydrolase family protein [Verrucomicrobiota bacterium]
MLLRARVVLPMVQPAIADGVVEITGRRLARISRWREFSTSEKRDVIDLGDIVLMPGLVNAHCHLDYSDMAGMLPAPKTFSDWIKGILALKSHWNYADYARSWLNGARMLVRHGVTTVADIEAVPELLPEVWDATPLRVFSFLEMTGVKSQRPAEAILQEAFQILESLAHRRNRGGFSPHAPYSTTAALLQLSAACARARGRWVTTHVAESLEEFEMFMDRRGAMFDWLKSQRDVTDCGGISPIQHLERQGVLGDNFLAVHVNYLAPGDAELLARRGASVTHCPRSHAYFGHQPFPRAALAAAGVNLCLGTDSLASVNKQQKQLPELNLFSEMQQFVSTMPEVSAAEILAMATVHGARALGLAGSVGELSAGAEADLIALPFGGMLKDAAESVVQHRGEVAAVMIEGEWVVQPKL